MNDVISGVVTVATGILSVAILAVLVSQRASTAKVISSAGGAFAQTLQAATNPYSGNSGSGFSNAMFSPGSFAGDNNYF